MARPRVSSIATGLVCFWLSLSLDLRAQTYEEIMSGAPDAPPATIRLKNGSLINGEVLDMKDGQLKVKTDFGGDVPVKWTEITELFSKLKLRLVLTDERILDGTVEPGEDDSLSVRTEDSDGPILVPFTAVTAINPPEPEPEPEKKDEISLKGNIQAGFSVLDGNSDTKAASGNGELVIRNVTHRGTLKGRTNYGEDNGKASARNSRASAKYDYFLTERRYLYTSGVLEGDSFQNLELRKVVSGGIGYQFLEDGDFENDFLSKLSAYGEIGVSYFHEDLQDTTVNEFVSGRWAAQVDWEFLPGKPKFFHSHQGYPNYEDLDDLLIDTEQGLRFNLLSGLTASLQINWKWDNVPAKGTKRSDTTYLFNLGCAFDTKR